jgi:hypothetical protein
MKNKILILSSVLVGCMLLAAGCIKIEDADSTVTTTSVPFVYVQNVNDAYVYGEGNTSIYSDFPDVIAIFVDTAVGFEGGYGGHTGMDTLKVLKSDIDWPDTLSVGGKSITFEKFNKANYKVSLTTNIVIAGAIANPGPTALEGTYLRAATGVLIELKKVFNGVYVIDNPGGSGTVGPFPYLLYNYKSSTGADSLAFPIQANPCGSGLQLVAPTAPLSLTSADYSTQYPPAITAASPLTLSWKVLEFPSARASSANPGAALCQWGTGVRTFVKQ